MKKQVKKIMYLQDYKFILNQVDSRNFIEGSLYGN